MARYDGRDALSIVPCWEWERCDQRPITLSAGHDHNHYLILNVAAGRSWGGQQRIDDALFPQQMLVDYVQVYALE